MSQTGFGGRKTPAWHVVVSQLNPVFSKLHASPSLYEVASVQLGLVESAGCNETVYSHCDGVQVVGVSMEFEWSDAE